MVNWRKDSSILFLGFVCLFRKTNCEFDYRPAPANPFCRHASNTVTATAFDRFKLR